MKKIILNFVIVSSIFISGCATIMGNNTQLLGIKSNPSNAKITIIDEKDKIIYSGSTPTTVTLNKSDGSYFGGKTYKIQITKKGFETKSIQVKASANGYFVLGNILFGGLIGWLIVDPLNGKMYNLSPENIDVDLNESASNNDEIKLNIVLLENLEEQYKAKLVEIN
jgi:uncharacterized protein YceK